MTSLRTVFIGPPGSGKGTQAQNLKRDYSVCHLSTGDLLREHVSKETEIGKKAKEYMSKGEHVPDDIVIDLIKGAIGQPACSKGFILDGFPRTIAQAEKLDEMLTKQNTKLDRAFEFAMEDALLIERISGRRIHPGSGRVYHVKFNPPKVADKDDLTGEPLIQRMDDTAELLSNRLKGYHHYTAPVIAYYQKKKILTVLDASKSPAEVYSKIRAALSDVKTPKL